MMPISCLNDWCQNNTAGDHSLRGSVPTDSVVQVPIKYIRLANNKLIEHQYCPFIINEKDSIIYLERQKYYIADSLYRQKVDVIYRANENLSKSLDKERKKRKIWAGTAIGAVAAFFVTVLLK